MINLDLHRIARLVTFLHMQALLKRPDLSEGLLSLTCRVLLVLGEESMYYNQALELSDRMQLSRCQVRHEGGTNFQPMMSNKLLQKAEVQEYRAMQVHF